MARLLLITALLCGCSEESTNGFPIMPGGGGQGSVGVVDAGVESDSGMSSQISGRVCLLDDARQPGSCAGSGRGGFTVAPRSHAATNAVHRSFAVEPPTGGSRTFSTITPVGPASVNL